MKKQTPVVTTLVDNKKDYNRRMVTYTVIMLVRLLCIGLLFVIPFPWNLLPIVFAVVSPWFAVLLANNAQVVRPELVKPNLSLEDKG